MNIHTPRQDLEGAEDPRNCLLARLEHLALAAAEQPGARPAVISCLQGVLNKLNHGACGTRALPSEASVGQVDELVPSVPGGFDDVELANLLVLLGTLRQNARGDAIRIQLIQWRNRIQRMLKVRRGTSI